MLRFHTQTGGVTLTAQQPMNNIVRVALQAFSAVCGGTQSLHTNGYDEALALPSEQAATIALRTQQVIAHESGAADSVDPFAGSYMIEALTDDIERRADVLIARVDALGGSLEAIPFITNEIDESAWSYQERYRTGQDLLVGVNCYVEEGEARVEGILQVDPASERDQVASARRVPGRARRDARRGPARRAASRRPAAARTCSSRSAPRCATAARSARSAARCARCSGATSRH
jgi:methylmalonyl-CoA mutase N-terminal domain/subunit